MWSNEKNAQEDFTSDQHINQPYTAFNKCKINGVNR